MDERVESITPANNDTKTESKREQNIIIHGINEGNDNDALYLHKLFDILGMGHTGPSISYRLGIKKCDRPWPVKVVMKSVDEKEEKRGEKRKIARII